MKRILFYLLFVFTLFSCSNNNSIKQEPSVTSGLLAGEKPYISPRLQTILNMADTCKSPIPIDSIFNIKSLLGNDNTNSLKLRTRAIGDHITYKGYSDYYVSGYKVPIKISTTQLLNLEFPTEVPSGSAADSTYTYYMTVYVVTLNIFNPGGTPKYVPDKNVAIGVNPDNLNMRGFSVTKITTNYYQCTTYLWIIHPIVDDRVQDYVTVVIPVSRLEPQQYEGDAIYAINNMLTWEYIVI